MRTWLAEGTLEWDQRLYEVLWSQVFYRRPKDFPMEDEIKLIELLKKHGPAWKKIQTHFYTYDEK